MNQVNRLPMQTSLEESYATAGPPQGQEESPFVIFHRLHQLLRGRYIIAITLAVIGATAGVVAGWKATVPKYQSVGSIRVMSNIPVKIYKDETLGQLGNNTMAFVRTQANLLQDPRVIDKAMRSPMWQELGRPSTPEERERFRKALSIVTEREDPEWIRVKFLDPSPKAAKAGVESVIDAYVEIFGNDEMIYTPKLMADLTNLKDRLAAEVRVAEQDIQRITLTWNTIDLQVVHKQRQEELQELTREIAKLEAQIRQGDLEAAAREADPAAGAREDPVALAAEISKVDPVVRHVLEEYMLSQARVRELRNRGLTDRNPDVQRSARRADDARRLLEEAVTNYINRGGVLPGNDMTMVVSIPPAVLESMKVNLSSLNKRHQQASAELAKLNSDIFLHQGKMEELRVMKDDLGAVERRLKIINVERTDDQTMSNRVRVMSMGEEPTSPYSDGRKKLAAVGFVLGGGMPVALIMLLGLLDGRFRYSDEAINPKRQAQLLGILPYLPARMHDPEQAAVAAHCVHQIRTLLQISGQMYDRRIFAVTSPTAGDGKTSLSLSLGLSFAAAGSKTLLLDFDMIGGGLTSGMQAKGDHGVMDAIEAGSAEEFIKPTSFPRLSILPIGRDDARQVSRLSPVVVQRLIDEVRSQFDVVVIDTGPILGSIEASLACAAADGVILTLGRGQQRQHADRAIEHISAIGAKLLGIVFNRADPGDFKRSVSSASVRSVPLIDKGHTGGNGHAAKLRALPAMGPMASTVASGMGRSDAGEAGE